MANVLQIQTGYRPQSTDIVDVKRCAEGWELREFVGDLLDTLNLAVGNPLSGDVLHARKHLTERVLKEIPAFVFNQDAVDLCLKKFRFFPTPAEIFAFFDERASALKSQPKTPFEKKVHEALDKARAEWHAMYRDHRDFGWVMKHWSDRARKLGLPECDLTLEAFLAHYQKAGLDGKPDWELAGPCEAIK